MAKTVKPTFFLVQHPLLLFPTKHYSIKCYGTVPTLDEVKFLMLVRTSYLMIGYMLSNHKSPCIAIFRKNFWGWVLEKWVRYGICLYKGNVENLCDCCPSAKWQLKGCTPLKRWFYAVFRLPLIAFFYFSAIFVRLTIVSSILNSIMFNLIACMRAVAAL